MPNLSPVDPRTLPALFAWFDAQYVNGFFNAQPAADAAVAQWNDLSGNGRHAVQGTGANQPLFRLVGGPNNNPSVNFVDSTDVMAIATAGTFARPVTVISVVKNTLADDAAYHKAVSFNAGRIAAGLDWATANAFAPFDDAAAQAGGTVAGDITTYHIETFEAKPVGSTSRMGVDGLHAGTAGIAGTNTNGDISLGVGGANGWIGHLCEALFFTGDLGPSVLYAVESGLAQKWNLYTQYRQAV
jgi:hypothetical protein